MKKFDVLTLKKNDFEDRKRKKGFELISNLETHFRLRIYKFY